MAKFEISPKLQISRRKFLTSASLGVSGIMLSGCDAFDSQLGVGDGLRSFLEGANGLTWRAQRLLAGDSLAPEFTEADIRQPQRPNGVTAPDDDVYKGLLANNFADWRLEVSGLVEKPLSLTREQLMNMPS
ncbi:MAG: molybdopterin oxidoreductase, partial [Mesorhizobium sp.]